MIVTSPRARQDQTESPLPVKRRVQRRNSHLRRGSLLAEVAISSIMLVIVMGMTVKILGWVALQRRAAERREQAALEAANMMERLAARPFDQLTPALASQCALPARTVEFLPGAELKVDITETRPGPDRLAKRIAIQVGWRNSAGEPVAPLRLTSWIEHRRKSR
jgi:hypothetical protein